MHALLISSFVKQKHGYRQLHQFSPLFVSMLRLVFCLKHDETHPAEVILIDLVPLVHTTSNGVGPVVEDVVVKLAVSPAELLLLKEQSIVEQRKSIEDVELCVLGKNQSVVHQLVEPLLLGCLVVWRAETGFGSIVPAIGGMNDLVLLVIDDRRVK
jgi:hypothetical protein